MNAISQHEFQAHWAVVRRRVRDRWPQLTARTVEEINGRVERLYWALVEECGLPRAVAARELWEFLHRESSQHAGYCSLN
jgi:hypothetical protein